MPEYQSRAFLYSPNGVDLKALNAFIESRGDYVQAGYDFVDEPGECTELFNMIDVAIAGDTIYVPSVTAFQYGTVSEFQECLMYFDSAKIKVVSMNEPDYQCDSYVTAISVVSREIMEKYVNVAKQIRQQLEQDIEALKAEKKALLKRGGRPKKEVQAIEALALYRTGKFQIDEICQHTGLGRSSLFRALADQADRESEETTGSVESE